MESICLAASDFGMQAQYKFLGVTSEFVAKLELTATKEGSQKWTSLINKRRSDRRYYSNRTLGNSLKASLVQQQEGQIKLTIFDDKADIAEFSRLTYAATFNIMSNPDFRNELASWVRNNWTKQSDGMPAYVQGMPGLISLIAKPMIRKNKGVAKSQAKKDAKRVEHSAAIGLIVTKSENPQNWLDAGRVYQRACLIALKDNVKTAGVSAAVIDPATVQQIRDSFKLGGDPVALIRFGYTKNTPKASPRRSVTDFVLATNA
jgi:hypothetical protein